MSDPEHNREEPGWFDRPENVSKLWYGLLAACGALFVVGLFTKGGAHYAIERFPGALEVLGFAGFILVVLAAKALRTFVMRDEDYYDRD